MFVRLHVCGFVGLCVREYVQRVFVSVFMCAYSCMCSYLHVLVCVFLRVLLCMYVFVCMFVCIFVCDCVYMRVFVCVRVSVIT